MIMTMTSTMGSMGHAFDNDNGSLCGPNEPGIKHWLGVRALTTASGAKCGGNTICPVTREGAYGVGVCGVILVKSISLTPASGAECGGHAIDAVRSKIRCAHRLGWLATQESG